MGGRQLNAWPLGGMNRQDAFARQVLRWLSILLLSAGGCAAYRPPPPLTPLSSNAFPTHLIIAVRDPLPSGGASPETREEFDLRLLAERTIDALRGADLFAEVGFLTEVSGNPDITIVAENDPHSNLEVNEMMMMSFLTLGVFPAYGTGSRSLYFRSACGPAISFKFPFHYTEFGGWFALLALPRSSWHFGLSKARDSYYYEQVNVFLRNHAPEFETLAQECKR
jgi:hypothetical protein